MPKTLLQPRYNPKYKIKSQTILRKANLSTPLPTNLHKFRNNSISGSGSVVYKQFYVSKKRIAEYFQLVDDSKIDSSILERGLKISHQHGAKYNVENHDIKVYFGENFS